jgi:hypothetical protein
MRRSDVAALAPVKIAIPIGDIALARDGAAAGSRNLLL